MSDIVIIGAGGHGREVLGVVRASTSPCNFVGFIDDGSAPLAALKRLSAPFLGSLNAARSAWRGGALEVDSLVIGIGSGELRRSVEEALPADWSRPVLIHKNASIDGDVRCAPGVVVFAQATVTSNIDLGRHVHIGRGAAIGHDSSIGDYSTVLPLAAVSGGVTLGEGCTVGSGAVIRQGVKVGDRAFVGAGAVVIRDVPAGVTVVGNPARAL